jgi:hypothetical protein
MSQDDDRRALERYVAGLPADPEALAHAVTERAVHRTLIVEALLKGLASADADRRLRTAERIAELHDLDPRLRARLGVLVDQDADARVAAASSATLRAHAAPVPGEPPPVADPPPVRVPRMTLGLRLLRVMDATAPVMFEALFADDAPALTGELEADGPDATRVVLHGLPDTLHGTTPELLAAREPGTLTPIARAEAPVGADGAATFRVAAPRDDVERWCRGGAGLAVVGDT